MAVPTVTPVPAMTVPAASAGTGAVVKVRVVPAVAPPKPQKALLQMTAEPLTGPGDTGAEPGTHREHEVHVPAFVVLEKLAPRVQGAHTRGAVVVQFVGAYWPAAQVGQVAHVGAA